MFERWGRPLLFKFFRRGYRPFVHLIPNGEHAKSLSQATRFYHDLLRIGADRSTPLVALGGGVVSDFTGYVASTFQRGLPWHALPTSIIAQTDASIGGKTGVNFGGVKNQIGSWYPPVAVASNPQWLSTEPERSYRGGLSEILKMMWISGAVSTRILFRDASALRERQPKALARYVAATARLKGDIVEQDERETGWRRVLNYGHTIGHAVESASRFSLTHGESVAIGMMAAARLGAVLGYTPPHVVREQLQILTAFSLPVNCPTELIKSALSLLAYDKKRSDGRMYWVLLRDFGAPGIVSGISLEQVRKSLHERNSDE